MIEADREVLADYLADLTPDEWASPSLCEGWSVAEVTAHLLVVPTVSKGKVILGFAGSGFNLDRFSSKMVAGILADHSTDDLVATLRRSAGSRNVPPGLKPPNVLGDLVVHALDIADGVGRPVDLPVDHVVAALDSFKDMQPGIGCRKRIAGLELRATDATWSHGEGPLVEGSAADLALAMTGRSSAIDRLDGDGVATLRTRG